MGTDAVNTLNRFEATPLYVQLENIFSEQISSGKWAVNTMIPSENELCKIYGVSRMTIRNVITKFVNEGTLYRVQGKGTFVNDSKLEVVGLHSKGLTEQLEKQGRNITTEFISCEVIPASDRVASNLNIIAGEDIYRVARVRSIDNEPFSYHQYHIPYKLFPTLGDTDFKNNNHLQMHEIMAKHRFFTIKRMSETVETFISKNDVSKMLKISDGFPLMLLEDFVYDEGYNVVEYTRIFYRGDKIKLRVEYTN